MKLPICIFDLRTGILCPRCQEKLRRGEITQLDFELSKKLLELEESGRFPDLKSVEYLKAYREDNYVVVLVKGIGNAMRPPWTKISKILSEHVGAKVRLVERGSLRMLVEQIIAPARLLGINTLWLPDGTEENTIRIPRADVRRLPAPCEALEKLISKITGVNARIILT